MITNFDGLIVRSGTQVNAAVFAAAKRLRIVGRAGVGVDNVDLAAATKAGVIVMNTPGGNTTAAAELSISLLLALARNIPAAVASTKGGKWERARFGGIELAGKTVGIVGLGRIGREVARWCQAFNMSVVGYDPLLSPEVALKAGITPVSLDELYGRSDFITLHVPKTAETTNMLCAATFAKLKRGVRIVNVARGGVVNEADLLAALNEGRIAGAALDVFSTEPPPAAAAALLAHPNVICTPHLGASTSEAQINVARDIAIQMADALDQTAFVGVVNATNLSLLSRPDLVPYTGIAERVGMLQAQLLTGKLQSVEVSLQGPLVSEPSVASALKTSVLKGLLTQMKGQGEVNFVNVPSLAAELGINVAVSTSAASASHTNLVTVKFVAATESRTISASVFSGNEARLVAIDGFALSNVGPKGILILWRNVDKPGVLKRVTSILGDAGINIASFSLGRHAANGEALGVLTVDNSVPADILEKLRDLPNVHNVRVAVLPSDEVSAHSAPHVAGESGAKPSARPSSASFGSGPTKKRTGWSLNALSDAALGRSHRSKLGKDKLKRAIDMTRSLLGLSKDYLVGIVPGSDTGAFEMAMWTMLGPRPVASVHFESFGSGWHSDLTKQLKIADVHEHTAAYGSLPDLSKVDTLNDDVVFTSNGTTSGVRVRDYSWIREDRHGITLNDATSAIFSQPVDFSKCDVTTFSWQKVLGAEGGHGMLILSPRARERLETYVPPRPLPKIMRLTNGKGKLEEGIFSGDTINTPSMLCVEDFLDSLKWAQSQGGVAGLTKRANANLAVIEAFVAKTPWISFLAKDKESRSNTSVCLTLNLTPEKVKQLTTLLEKEKVAFDIGSYRDAPPGLRIWAGATVETEDMEILMEWVAWAYRQVQ